MMVAHVLSLLMEKEIKDYSLSEDGSDSKENKGESEDKGKFQR